MDNNSSGQIIKVLIADDHPMVRYGVKHTLDFQQGLEIVGEAEDSQAVCRLVKELVPDVILLDINMPGEGGLWLTQKLKEDYPNTKILIFTFHDEEGYILDALRAGANGYILKEADGSELAKAIKDVYNGGSYVHPSLAGKVFNQLHKLNPGGSKKGPGDREELSSRELEVLELIVRGRSNKEIGQQLFISEKTVKNHISSILRKMGLEDRTQAAIAAVKSGIVKI